MRERERDLNGRVPSYSTTEMKVSTACAVNYRRRTNEVGRALAMRLCKNDSN